MAIDYDPEDSLNNPLMRYQLIEKYFRENPYRAVPLKNIFYRNEVSEAKEGYLQAKMLTNLARGGFL